MDVTISRSFPGATAFVEDTPFTVLQPNYPRLQLRTPRGIVIGCEAFSWRDIEERRAASSYPFERIGRMHQRTYKLRGAQLYGKALSGGLVALWTSSDPDLEEHRNVCLALAKVDEVLRVGGGPENAEFFAKLEFNVALRWTLQDFPPYTKWVTGQGWHYLPGYYASLMSRD